MLFFYVLSTLVIYLLADLPQGDITMNIYFYFFLQEWEDVCTYFAMLDAPHGSHGGKATDEGAALLLQTVHLHLFIQFNTTQVMVS